MKKDAILSEDRKYRYVLSRIWDESKPMVVIVGLNPSTADEKDDDSTIKKCINFAKNWGYGGLYMLNLFAFRATLPSDMFNASYPIGEENDKYIRKYSKFSDKVICAWGNDGSFKNRSQEVLSILENKFYIKLNKSGEPAHPLYLSKDLIPIKF
ncbi:DUF1643 domain-containing protein [Aliarcobacter butzleri]|uniref:DUF1643 domain-containing protein n=1 Tax=Aliarcobacter butzleri TaxID=28197 RepID=UPI0021B44007|nr:DUF1643 domain-containing protein [Aliarcobacter butzleri]MCT7584670.1 DUF1643 domain-containing protein [Aliarcobacter butzleri]